jgi:hypothetical protein
MTEAVVARNSLLTRREIAPDLDALLAASTSSWARLGDTYEQAQTRYGLEKKDPAAKFRTSLLEGAKELTFEFHGWRIRCALLLATDGNQYVVRQEYTKILNSSVQRTGGTPTIRDFECEAVLEGEKGSQVWRPRVVAQLGKDVSSTFANQVALSTGLTGTNWVRDDGSTACLLLGRMSIVLSLPQALKREAELKLQKEQKARAAVPKF